MQVHVLESARFKCDTGSGVGSTHFSGKLTAKQKDRYSAKMAESGDFDTVSNVKIRWYNGGTLHPDYTKQCI